MVLLHDKHFIMQYFFDLTLNPLFVKQIRRGI